MGSLEAGKSGHGVLIQSPRDPSDDFNHKQKNSLALKNKKRIKYYYFDLKNELYYFVFLNK